MPSANESKLLSLVIKGLEKKPTLVAVFGICLLGFFVTAATLVAGQVTEKTNFWFYGAFLSFLVGGLVSAIVVGREVGTAAPVLGLGSLRQDNGSAESSAFGSELQPILSSMRQAARFKNEVFLQEIRRECSAFGVSADHWAQGRISVPPGRYNEVLLKLYESAKRSVFCTSFTEYRSTWQSELGNLILRAHDRSGAKVTRVFIFDKFEEIVPADIVAMKLQAKIRQIEVLVFIDKEYPAFDFPPDVTRDFTIIDEQTAIGITSTFGSNKLSADWYFDNEAKFKNLHYIQSSVVQGCHKLDDFLKTRWDKDLE
jgi:hypothetical protein